MTDSALPALRASKPFQSPLNPADLLLIDQDTATTPESRAMTAQELVDELQAEFDFVAVAPGASGNVLTSNGSAWTSDAPAGGGGFNQGFMTNGKISVTVASNNITVALKTLAGANPSAGDPVQVRIGDTVRDITAALSVTKNAGTNWFNAGSAELATQLINYFVYLGYNATDGVVIGFSRIPYATLYSEFSATTTNEKYAGISTITNAAAGDNYVNIGRFSATLSAGSGYTWTVPTFTAANLIQRPIYETDFLTWLPTITGFSSNPTGVVYRYKVIGKDVRITNRQTSNGTSNATTWTMTAPFTALTLTDGLWGVMGGNTVDNGTGSNVPGFVTIATGSATINVFKDALGAAWTASNGKRFTIFDMSYPIA